MRHPGAFSNHITYQLSIFPSELELHKNRTGDMEYKKQGSDSESTLPTANNDPQQRMEYAHRSQEEMVDSVFRPGRNNIPRHPHVENDLASASVAAGSRRQDLEDNAPDAQTKPPRRPMTSYNIFFLLERERIISGGEERRYTVEDARNMVALQKWRDVHFKRKHRKSHGMITFKDLSIRAAAAWKKLDVESKKIFHDCAAVEKDNYARELHAWKNNEKRQRGTNSPSDQLLGNEDQKLPPNPLFSNHDALVMAPVPPPPPPIGYTVRSGDYIPNHDTALVASVPPPVCYSGRSGDYVQNPPPPPHMPLVHPDIDVTSMNYHQYYQTLAGLPATIQFPGEPNLAAQSSGETATASLLRRRGSGDSLGSWVAKGEEGTWSSSTASPPMLTRQKAAVYKMEQDAMLDDETVGTFNP